MGRLRQNATTRGVGLEDKCPLPALEPTGSGSQAHKNAPHTTDTENKNSKVVGASRTTSHECRANKTSHMPCVWGLVV